MGREPSDKTQLRQTRSELKRWKERWQASATEANQYRSRATQAEQDAAEWKRRFDLLLSRGLFTLPSADENEKLEQCLQLLRADPKQNYIPAIKKHRELFHSDLKTAVDAIKPERDRLAVTV